MAEATDRCSASLDFQTRAAHPRRFDRLRAAQLRLAVLDVDGLPLDVALRRPGLARGAHGASAVGDLNRWLWPRATTLCVCARAVCCCTGPSALLGHVSILVQGLQGLHERPDDGRGGLRRSDGHAPDRRRRVHGALGPQPAAHGDGALRRVVPGRDGRARARRLRGARLLERQLSGSRPRAQRGADVDVADGQRRLRREGARASARARERASARARAPTTSQPRAPTSHTRAPRSGGRTRV